MRVEGNDQRLAAAVASQMQQTGAQKILASQSPQQSQQSHDTTSDEAVQSVVGDKVTIKVEVPKNTLDTLNKMGNLSDFLNSVATSLRQTSEGLKATTSIVEEMKTTLDKIIKNYPPYSLENKERIDQLMNYSSLKKQILSLMVPAPPPPIYENVKHLWEDLFSGNNNTIQTPTLPTDVPDAHVKSAASQLDNLSHQIGLLQDALGSSVGKG